MLKRSMLMLFVMMLLALAAGSLVPGMGGAARAAGKSGASAVPANLDHHPEALRKAQKQLITLGYLEGNADGKYGPKTKAALRAFQKANKLTVNGHLDKPTWSLLKKLTSRAGEIVDVQRQLIDLGYLQGIADGIWGPRSTAAMKAFQSLNGLEVSGSIDSASRDALFSGNAITLPRGLSSGDKGEEVLTLQQHLIRFGFFAGKADGAYGKKTVKAVKAFQSHLIEQGYSVTADGSATPLTLFYLYSGEYSSYRGDIRLDSTGSEARRAETRLAALGYMDAAPDDTFDSYAVEALMLFQKKAGLPESGVADKDTIDALFSASAPPADQCALHGIASGDSGLVVGYVEEALVTGGMTALLPHGQYDAEMEAAIGELHQYLQAKPDVAALYADEKQLSKKAVSMLLKGLRNPGSGNVKNEAEAARIQRRLHALYYLARTDIDGKFGRDSTAALRAFQETNNLPETGEADQDTLARLFSAEAVAKQYPYRVEVSLSAQTVSVYQLNDGGYKRVQVFTCSTGLNDSTPRGIFTDGFPVSRWHYFKKFDCWAQYSFDIEGDIMFHSVIYSSKNEKSLRTSSVHALGSPASHGCIRLSVEDAKWLYENCRRGSLVIIIR